MPQSAPGRVVRGIGWNFVGMALGSVAGFLTSIVLARLLGPSDYGSLALVLSVLNVLVVASSLGFEFALNKFIPILATERRAGAILPLVRSLTLAKLALSLALAAVVLLVARPVAEGFFKKPELTLYIQLLTLMVVPYSLEPIFRAVLTGFYLQKFINLLDAGAKLLYFVLASVVLLARYGVVGVLLVNLLANLVFVSLAARRSYAVLPREEGGTTPAPLRAVLKYSLILYIYTIMNFILGQQLDLIMIGSMLEDVREVAFYTVAYSLSYTVLSFLSLALMGGITLTYFSELHAQRDMEGLRRGYIVMLEYLFVFIIPLAAVGALLAPEILMLLYGESFATGRAVLLLSLYFPTMALIKIGTLTSTFMSAMDQERRLVTSRAIFGCVNIVLNYLLIPRYGALGALAGTTTASIVGAIYECLIVHASLRPRYPVRFIRRMLSISLIAGGAALLVRQIFCPVNPWTGAWGATAVLVVVGVPWLVLVVALFVALRPLSPETVEVIASLPLPLKSRILRLLR
ncbi:MAG: oligosaccharide flippase family protein [Thermoplasmatota archaeon]